MKTRCSRVLGAPTTRVVNSDMVVYGRRCEGSEEEKSEKKKKKKKEGRLQPFLFLRPSVMLDTDEPVKRQLEAVTLKK